MLEDYLGKYNGQCQKIIKLCVILFASYMALVNVSLHEISELEIIKIITIIGITFIILDNYFPTVDYQ